MGEECAGRRKLGLAPSYAFRRIPHLPYLPFHCL